ncbi:hypothetical protein [Anatilimnocola floriformis]|uniref:hypothetical protein n=1 Tax=Anatilimnocola floriformis TaxID=2948575 RepID=UPI0020C3C621|nr:hypothetical protein [Anatilimnocola floriformis]
MRFSLRTLLILLILAPPLAAAIWREIDKRRIVTTIEEDSWMDVGGPEFINGFSTNCGLGDDPAEEIAETTAPPAFLETVDHTEAP